MRSKIAAEQPVILVIDGTKHLTDDAAGHRMARYPDAYQGYLNQVVAINEGLGFRHEDYSSLGKEQEHVQKLREHQDFMETAEVYAHHARSSPRAYSFHFWNTAGLNLAIRKNRKFDAKISPFSPDRLNGPALIFCNVGVLNEQLPAELREKYSSLKHQPAFFDDNSAILELSFTHDKFGIHFTNVLEHMVSEAYAAHKKGPMTDALPVIVRYMSHSPMAVAAD
jgi:hypothetical protein